MAAKKFYLTTAITYANSKPHIGHAYEEIAADVLARWKRANGFDVFFVTGSDEHSANVEARAQELGKTSQDYCNEMAEIFRDTWKQLNISYDRFIQTSEPAHHRASQEMVKRAMAAGAIYQGHYEGWYCKSCENYYTEADLRAGLCPVHGIKPDWLAEANYFFKLSSYQQRLIDHIEKNPSFIEPETRRNEVMNIIKGGLRDISISRSSTRWGIPFPEDPQQVIYVWFDALINYISAIGFPDNLALFNRYWPADLHIVGKDITRFHCIIWPAMLMATNLPLPKHVFGHGFLSFKGEKMSKTRGNVLDPLELKMKYGTDAVRYVLIAANNFSGDSDFSEEILIDRYNSDLANDLGNLLNRTLTMVEKYCQGLVPTLAAHQASPIKAYADTLYREIEACINPETNHLDFSAALSKIWELINLGNKYIEESAPWVLFKKGETAGVDIIMYNLMESLRLVACLIQPFMPETTQRIFQQLGDPLPQRAVMFPADTQWGLLPAGQKTAKQGPLFPRIEKEKKLQE